MATIEFLTDSTVKIIDGATVVDGGEIVGVFPLLDDRCFVIDPDNRSQFWFCEIGAATANPDEYTLKAYVRYEWERFHPDTLGELGGDVIVDELDADAEAVAVIEAAQVETEIEIITEML